MSPFAPSDPGSCLGRSALGADPGVTCTNVGVWDGQQWHALGAGLGTTNGNVTCLAMYGNQLVAGGYITNSGTLPLRGLAIWDGSAWRDLGGGVNSRVNALAVRGTDLIVSGIFTEAGGVTAKNIALWNGSVWSTLGSGLADPPGSVQSVSALAVFNDEIYAGGAFLTAGNVSARRVARWDGVQWQPLGEGVNDSLAAFTIHGTELVAVGAFTQADGLIVNGVGRWNGASWSAFTDSPAKGASFFVLGLAGDERNVYAGGVFSAVGQTRANAIARWDGQDWFALGGGLTFASGNSATVRPILLANDGIIVGGSFDRAGGSPARNVARWDGAEWHALGTGVDSTVSALAADGANLYAGGTFTNAGSVRVNRVAVWNGTEWSALSSGMNNTVSALALWNGQLYAGGSFTMAGTMPAKSIAKWDGSSWQAVGAGVAGTVFHILPVGSTLYLAGRFAAVDNVQAWNVARWGGATWEPIGGGITGISSQSAVYRLAYVNNRLYAVGEFSVAGGRPAAGIAVWNGTEWQGLGSGVQDWLRDEPFLSSLAVIGEDVWVAGGTMRWAGGKPSFYLGHWNAMVNYDISGGFMIRQVQLGSDARLHFRLDHPGRLVLEGSDDLRTWSEVLRLEGPADIDQPRVGQHYFFRAHRE